MASYYKKCGNNRAVCIGSMDRLISLKTRVIQTPDGSSVDYSESFSTLASEWAAVKSLSRGPIFLDGTNIAKQATHIFMIRYRSDVDAEIWIDLDSVYYDVLNVEDLDEKNEFLFLYAVKRGGTSIPINQV